MNQTNKRPDRSTWVIGGMTLAGLGVGLILLPISALWMVASIIIGIGLGIVIASIISSRND
jgi:purine-cytosine permease-like protein